MTKLSHKIQNTMKPSFGLFCHFGAYWFFLLFSSTKRLNPNRLKRLQKLNQESKKFNFHEFGYKLK